MRIIKLSLLAVFILAPMMFINDLRVKNQEYAIETILRYDQGIHAAVQDAAYAMQLNELQEFEAKYDSLQNFRANKEYAIDAFFKTLYQNFGIGNDPVAQGVLNHYIPVIAAVDYNGYWIYANETYINSAGENENRHVWKLKKPYAYSDAAGNSLSFTLDDYVYAYDAQSKSWYEGHREDVNVVTAGRIPILSDPNVFEQVRRSTIVQAIQSDLAYAINSHNEYVRRFGITYTFTLPTISQEEWNNTINDIGVMAFIQGLPVGQKEYNVYALGGGRLIKRPAIYGAIRDGVKIYYRSSCSYPDTVIEKFTSEKAAAAKGYFPRPCLNK
jgi:hypothetical protein